MIQCLVRWVMKTLVIRKQHRSGAAVGFAAANRAAVDEFHQRALQAGGADAGAPGFRDVGPNVYAAYVRDLDGHKIVASCISEH